MVDKIEMSLDDIIKSTKGMGLRNNRRAPGRGPMGRRGGASGGNFPQRQRNLRGGGVQKGRNAAGISRANGRFPRGDVNGAWKHDMFESGKRKNLRGPGGMGGGGGGNSTAKLLVSNLDYGVSESDINELFADFGPLKSASVHYDRSGRSLGTADVVFERRGDAVKAMKQYNGVPLDGRPMNIQLATSDVPTLSPAINRNRFQGPRPGNQRGGPQRRNMGNNAGGGGGGGPRRQGARNARPPAPTAEQLDAELDAYVKDMK
ncbi:THO complex subunit 4 [Phlebotomus papatasi]|uniref:THO complex subunit 4 n=1 Tax=Phlebotomus papatasi TaxID=29031 RepID=UPI0024839D75|nr:THO complex subunit 4 [Phlebotomus papatasi]